MMTSPALCAYPDISETLLTLPSSLSGINALIYYSNTLFTQSLKFNTELAALMSGFLNTWLFVASFIPCKRFSARVEN